MVVSGGFDGQAGDAPFVVRGTLIGYFFGLASAVTWALSSILIKSQSDRLSVLSINWLRCGTASIVMLLVLAVTGRYHAFALVTPSLIAYLLLSVTAGLLIGDSLFFRSQALMGVARALPISGSYPLFTLLIAAVVLREPLTARAVAGTVLVVAAVVVIALPGRVVQPAISALPARRVKQGLGLAVMASICWAVSTSLLRVGLSDFDVVAASCIRLPVSAVVLSIISSQQRGRKPISNAGWRSIGVVMAAGVVGTALGSVTFLAAIQTGGAAQAATLSATAPLWAAPLSALFLREHVGLRIFGGIIISVLGIWLLV